MEYDIFFIIFYICIYFNVVVKIKNFLINRYTKIMKNNELNINIKKKKY